MRFALLFFCLLLSCSRGQAQPKRVLYVTYSAGYRHDSIPASIEVMQQIASANGALEVVASEDLSLISAAGLKDFDALFFFTSGELPIGDSQKQDLLDFVRSGKGFGGVHSATDTFYTWPDYGDLIGARFNGHPWVQNVRIDIEDPDHPSVYDLKPSFSIMDEIYQFRDFSRERDRVLMTLDTKSVDLTTPGVNPGTDDFPLAWCRNYGSGRVLYVALGHFESTWRDQRFQKLLLQSLLWLTGQVAGDATPRAGVQPNLAPNGIANAASFSPPMAISPGSFISIYGTGLTSGSTLAADAGTASLKLAGTSVRLSGTPVPLLYASAALVNAYVPLDLQGSSFDVGLSVAGGGTATSTVAGMDATPGIFTVTTAQNYATVWATGLGPVDQSGQFQVTRTQPMVTVAGAPAQILFSGLAPGIPGLYLVNVGLPVGLALPALLDFRFGNYESTVRLK